jgi:hypothetical protein
MIQYPRRHLDDREVHRRWMDPRLALLRLEEIRAYLERKGWKRVRPADLPEAVYQEPGSEEEPLYQWLPESEQRRDYLQRVYELLAGIAEHEGRLAGEVLTEMLGHSGDSPDGNGAATTAAEAEAR